MKHNIALIDNEAIAPSVRLPNFPFEHTWTSYENTTSENIVDRLQDATIAITCGTPIRAEHLDQLPKLQMIAMALTGTDAVDLDYCAKNNIIVTNVPAASTVSVAEHGICMMMDLFRQVSNYHRLMQRLARQEIDAKNIYFDYRIRNIAGRQIGFIGHGDIAQHMARLAEGLGMTVKFYDRDGKYTGDQYLPLNQLLSESDVISINVPLTTSTQNLIDDNEFGLMKKDAILINTARGGIINETALIRALEEDRIGGVGLDVLENEPYDPQDPFIQKMIDNPKVLLTPHVAWSSEDSMQNLIAPAFHKVIEFATGNPPQSITQKESL